MKGIITNGICIDYDPAGEHVEKCSWWHGGICDCRPGMVLATVMRHCHECNFVNAYDGATPCSCGGFCICEREHGCPCVEDNLPPRIRSVS